MFFNVPGLHNSGEAHWQTIWEQKYPQSFKRLEQQDWDAPDCTTWISSIEEQLKGHDTEHCVLIGHSVGCATIVHWALNYGKSIKGALFVAPSDVDRPNYPIYITGFSPMPEVKLPFKSIVVASTNDHVVDIERASHFARCWGSDFYTIHEAGHIEARSGFGNWPEGLGLLKKLDPNFIL